MVALPSGLGLSLGSYQNPKEQYWQDYEEYEPLSREDTAFRALRMVRTVPLTQFLIWFRVSQDFDLHSAVALRVCVKIGRSQEHSFQWIEQTPAKGPTRRAIRCIQERAPMRATRHRFTLRTSLVRSHQPAIFSDPGPSTAPASVFKITVLVERVVPKDGRPMSDCSTVDDFQPITTGGSSILELSFKSAVALENMGYSIPIVPKISTSGFMKPSQEADVNKGDVPKVSSSSEQRERSKSRQDGGECDAPNANPNSSGEKQDDGVIGQPQKPPTVGYSSHLLSKTYRTPSVAQGDSRTLVPAKPTAPAVKQDKASAPASEGPGKIKSDIYAAFFEEARASALKEYQQVQSDGNDQSTGGQGNVSSSKRKAHPSEANTDLAYKHPRLEQSVESSPAIAEKFIDQAGNVSSVVVPEIPSSTGATEIVRTETASCPSVVANELDGQVKTNTAHISGIDPPLQVQVTEEKEGPHPETVAGNLPKDVVDLTVEEEGDRLQIKQERADHPATWEGDGGDVDDNERQSLLRVEAGRTEVEVETP